MAGRGFAASTTSADAARPHGRGAPAVEALRSKLEQLGVQLALLKTRLRTASLNDARLIRAEINRVNVAASQARRDLKLKG